MLSPENCSQKVSRYDCTSQIDDSVLLTVGHDGRSMVLQVFEIFELAERRNDGDCPRYGHLTDSGSDELLDRL